MSAGSTPLAKNAALMMKGAKAQSAMMIAQKNIINNMSGSDVAQAAHDAAAGATDLEKMMKELAGSYGFAKQFQQKVPTYSSNQQGMTSGSLLMLGGMR